MISMTMDDMLFHLELLVSDTGLINLKEGGRVDVCEKDIEHNAYLYSFDSDFALFGC